MADQKKTKFDVTITIDADAIDEAMDAVSTALRPVPGIEITNITENYDAKTARQKKGKKGVEAVGPTTD
jgi:hypothetical protein